LTEQIFLHRVTKARYAERCN